MQNNRCILGATLAIYTSSPVFISPASTPKHNRTLILRKPALRAMGNNNNYFTELLEELKVMVFRLIDTEREPVVARGEGSLGRWVKEMKKHK